MPNCAEQKAKPPHSVLPAADLETEPTAARRSAASDRSACATAPATTESLQQREIGGPTGPEPTRFGDWEKKGRCIDF